MNIASDDEMALVRQVAEGDDDALRILMDRHDRLVRFTVFRVAPQQCVRDPQWLDAVASETWGGFVTAARRGIELKSQSITRYLGGIARQQTISALRRLRVFARTPENALTDAQLAQRASQDDDPQALSAELELLTAVRDCAGQLGDEDRLLFSQLALVTQRKWVEAAAALGLSESTLRSRWDRVLERLRACLEKNTR